MSDDPVALRAEQVTATVAGWSSPPVDLVLQPGELVAVSGLARSGKSTIIHLLAGWLPPTAGTVSWPGCPGAEPSWSHLAVMPQALAVLYELTVIENIELARRTLAPASKAPPALERLLERLDLADLRDRAMAEISIGERQRVMAARALVDAPAIILADEPVAHQDESRADAVLQLLAEAVQAGAACVVATREPTIAARADRVISL